ncbi:MAG: carboxypeptidase-like regulatory domain-containing protein, partial [Marinilabiliaceae bacterium]|nr:carboxypeptidase-like regulatory domain-containing protein [Marinilabiliaceae bacterium]
MLILMVLIPVSALAQNQTIKGVVKDATTNDPLPGVNVVVKGTTTGTITDFDGNYTISAPSNGTLTFSFIGYELTEEAVNGRSTIDVALKSD